MNGLIDEVGERDHGERKGAEKVVGAGGKEGRGNVPHQESGNAGERDGSQEDGDGSVGSVEAGVHDADYIGRVIRISRQLSEFSAG